MTSKQGRTDDIGAKLMRHRRALYGYVFTCVRDEHLTEDILQDVAEIALSSYDKLRDPERFDHWLFGIARRRVLAEKRNSQRMQSLPPDVIDLLTVEAEHTLPTAVIERKAFLMQCIGELPADQRDLLRQRYDGSADNVDELASRLGRTVQAVYGILKRTRMKLAACVEKKIKKADR